MSLLLTEVLVGTTALAGGTAVTLGIRGRWRCRRLYEQVLDLEAERSAQDHVLYSLGDPHLLDWLRAAQPSSDVTSLVQLPPRLRGTKFLGRVQRLGEQVARSVQVLREEARLEATREIEKRAADDTRAAVRAFASQLASQGTDLGRSVGDMLRRQTDADLVEELLQLDHLAQQQVRTAQAYVVLCGGRPGRSWPATSFTDVVRGAMSRIRDYRRVRSQELEVLVAGPVVEPLVQIVAALLDNATRFSPPNAWVQVNLQHGTQGVTVVIDDAGLRMNEEQLADAQALLTRQRLTDIHTLGPVPQTGFPVVAELAARYGFQAWVDAPSPFGGTRALVFVPAAQLAAPAEHNAPEPQAATPVNTGVTTGGLPKRARRPAAPAAAPPAAAGPLARPTPAGAAGPGAVAAWSQGTRSGRAAAHGINPQQEEV
ncbi:ATP-binding protein [Streptomyces noboritoensis]|uniref:histidine kinase n=1 Tax=Streptomyces noboritoensis TaxID=67337 RepID=A0ABV6TG72_9ACTN